MATTEITVGDGSAESSAAAHWSDLPDDLLGMVRSMVSSLRDRVRLAAVCKPWRGAASRLPAPPAVPLLLLLVPNSDGKTRHLCGPDESWVLRVPDKAVVKNKLRMRFAGSHSNGWIAAVNNFQLVMVNLFSGSEVVAPTLRPGFLRQNPITKIIFSQAPTSNRCMLATVTTGRLEVAVCKLGCRSGWTIKAWNEKFFTDIAFYDGDLYGLLHLTEELIKFTIGMEKDGTPVITAAHQVAIQTRDGPRLPYGPTYIFELHGKLAMAVRTQWLPNREHFFKVFNLGHVDTGEAYKNKWEEVTDFGEYALFLGPMCSMAVHVSVGAERRGLERNHIYYSSTTYSEESKLPGHKVYSMTVDNGDRCIRMYCQEDPDMGDGVKRTGYYIQGWRDNSMWIYPPYF
ncbi:unnamed protein product [Alopecurus aequalis]